MSARNVSSKVIRYFRSLPKNRKQLKLRVEDLTRTMEKRTLQRQNNVS